MCGSYLAQNTTDFRVLDVLLDNWTDEMGLMNAKDTSNGFVIADILRKRLETVAWVSTFGKRNSVLPQLLYLIQREQITRLVLLLEPEGTFRRRRRSVRPGSHSHADARPVASDSSQLGGRMGIQPCGRCRRRSGSGASEHAPYTGHGAGETEHACLPRHRCADCASVPTPQPVGDSRLLVIDRHRPASRNPCSDPSGGLCAGPRPFAPAGRARAPALLPGPAVTRRLCLAPPLCGGAAAT